METKATEVGAEDDIQKKAQESLSDREWPFHSY